MFGNYAMLFVFLLHRDFSLIFVFCYQLIFYPFFTHFLLPGNLNELFFQYIGHYLIQLL